MRGWNQTGKEKKRKKIKVWPLKEFIVQPYREGLDVHTGPSTSSDENIQRSLFVASISQ